MHSPPGVQWHITIRDPADLRTQFGTVGAAVPTRNEPKDQFAEEAYCLRRYLVALADAGVLTFPVIVSKGETPDFIVTCADGEAVGLEVTKATRKEFEADLTRFSRNQKTKDYPSDQVAGAMVLSISGWIRDQAEKELAGYIIAAIREKTADLDSYPLSQAALLVHDNTPTPAVNLETVADVVRRELVNNPILSPLARSFRKISVIREPKLIYDIAGTCRIL